MGLLILEAICRYQKKNTEGGRKKRGYYLTDEENERVKAFINELKVAK